MNSTDGLYLMMLVVVVVMVVVVVVVMAGRKLAAGTCPVTPHHIPGDLNRSRDTEENVLFSTGKVPFIMDRSQQNLYCL